MLISTMRVSWQGDLHLEECETSVIQTQNFKTGLELKLQIKHTRPPYKAQLFAFKT